MISVENLPLLIEKLLISPVYLHSWIFAPRYSTIAENLTFFENKFNSYDYDSTNGKCIWWHEEPINQIDFDNLHLRFQSMGSGQVVIDSMPGSISLVNSEVHFHLFINSEYSSLKKELLKKWKLYDWYFFFHGFAALNWYSEYKYFLFKNNKFDKVFISLNHNVLKKRSYRLYLLSLLKSCNLSEHGFISCPTLSQKLIKEEIFDQNSNLSIVAKKHILQHLYPSAHPLILDDCNYNDASSTVGDSLNYNMRNKNYHVNAFWHIVSETVYYDDKLHLTEKIFKPIVLQRPFILVGGKDNLKYLQSYGFKTFSSWIDESYDDESDPDFRLIKIVEEIKKLCLLSDEKLQSMYKDMQEILEFNHKHFYTNFKDIIVNELVDNFEGCIKQYNLHLSERYRVPIDRINFTEVKDILKS